MYYATLGLVCSSVAVLAGFRPLGVPISYLLLVVCFFWAMSRGMRMAPAQRQVASAFGLTAALAVIYVPIFAEAEDLPLSARTVIGFTLFFLVLSSVHTVKDLTAVALGTLPLYIINSIFGIAQYFGVPEAILGSAAFIVDTQDLDHFIAALDGGDIRGWGVMAHPHVYAFSTALWTLFLAAVVFTRDQDEHPLSRLSLNISLLIGIAATILTAQRSAVWIVVVGLLALWIAKSHLSKLFKAAFLATVVITGAGLVAVMNESEHPLQRLSQVEDAAQSERVDSWRRAALMIEEDPLFGTAYRVMSGYRGIHNGFLAGWARFGFLWLVLLCISLLLTFRLIIKSRATSIAKVGASFLIFETLAHGATHTNFITAGDLIAWCYIGFALVLVGERSPSPHAERAMHYWNSAPPRTHIASE